MIPPPSSRVSSISASLEASDPQQGPSAALCALTFHLWNVSAHNGGAAPGARTRDGSRARVWVRCERGDGGPGGSVRPERHHSRTAQRFFFATAYSPRSGETADGVPTSSSQAASAWESP